MEQERALGYHDKLKIKIHYYIKDIYKITKYFPKEELYGITSQLRRSSLSVMLNYVEGYARRRGDNCKVYKNFLDISYGSLKESKYLIYLSYSENFFNKNIYNRLLKLSDEIGAMIYKINK